MAGYKDSLDKIIELSESGVNAAALAVTKGHCGLEDVKKLAGTLGAIFSVITSTAIEMKDPGFLSWSKTALEEELSRLGIMPDQDLVKWIARDHGGGFDMIGPVLHPGHSIFTMRVDFAGAPEELWPHLALVTARLSKLAELEFHRLNLTFYSGEHFSGFGYMFNKDA